MPVHLPLVEKRGEEIRQLRVREIVPVVDENVCVRQGQHRLGIGHEHVRQRRGAGVAVGRREHRLVDGVRVRDAADLHADVLLVADGVVERVDEVVERGLGLAAVDVPDRHGHGFASAAAAGAAEQQREGKQQRGDTRTVVHPGTSLQGVFFSIANFSRPGNQNPHIFYTCLDTGRVPALS